MPLMIVTVLPVLQQQPSLKFLAVNTAVYKGNLHGNAAVKVIEQIGKLPQLVSLLIFGQRSIVYIRHQIGFAVKVHCLAPDLDIAAVQHNVIRDEILIGERLNYRALDRLLLFGLLFLICFRRALTLFVLLSSRLLFFQSASPFLSYSPVSIRCRTIRSSRHPYT